jgi:hypothetical protein
MIIIIELIKFDVQSTARTSLDRAKQKENNPNDFEAIALALDPPKTADRAKAIKTCQVAE